MDVTDAVETRLEIREFANEPVDDGTKRAILDAGRLAPSGKNTQHWRFVLVSGGDLAELADRSPTGGWVADAAFAVAICTDPSYPYNGIDAGRAATHMQLVAWEEGIGSCLYTTGEEAAEFLSVPEEYELTAVLGFGYPARDVEGRKDREPLENVVFGGRFGEDMALKE